MAIDSISNENIDALIESAELLKKETSGVIFKTHAIDLIRNHSERDRSWPEAYSGMREVASKIECLLNDMGWSASRLDPLIEKTLEARSLSTYTFKHSEQLISRPDLIVEHLMHQLERQKPLSPSLLCSLIFIAYKADTYPKSWMAASLSPPSSSEKMVAIYAYRAGHSLNKIIKLSQSGADRKSNVFKENLANELAVFSKELTLLYQALFNLAKASPSALV